MYCNTVSAHFLTSKYKRLHLLVCIGDGLDDFLLLYFSFVVNQWFGHVPTFPVTQHVCAEGGGARTNTFYFEICRKEVAVGRGWTANCRFVVVLSS